MKTISILLLLALSTPLFAVSTVPEPETIFYGRIVNRAEPQDYLLTSGVLQWTISRDQGEALQFTTELTPLANGAYSYRLAIPHSALALDLEASPDSIPLGGTGSTHEHLSITVNGHPATITSGDDGGFVAAQAARASTYRLDLAVEFAPTDSDGDGLADWWEERHGLDRQSDDAQSDPDGDGRSNFVDFTEGTDPNRDDRRPSLLTTEVSVAAAGTSGIHLQSNDADTPPSERFYTLRRLPEHGTITFLGRTRWVAWRLSPGSTFSQADLDEGRLRYTTDNASETDSLVVSLHDEHPDPASSRPRAGTLASLCACPGSAAYFGATRALRDCNAQANTCPQVVAWQPTQASTLRAPD